MRQNHSRATLLPSRTALQLPPSTLARHLGYIFLKVTRRGDAVLLDTDAAAAYLSVPRRYMYRLTSERRITYVKLGRMLRFRKADLDAYIDARLTRALDQPAR